MHSPTVSVYRTLAYRGERPRGRGWVHAVAALLGIVAATALTTYAWIFLSPTQAISVGIYGVGMVALFSVSATYHLGQWRTPATVVRWRRADHSTIAVFIAATYTPLCVLSVSAPTRTWMLAAAWIGAGASLALSMLWIDHPRWLDVAVFLILGWLVVPIIPQLIAATSMTVVGLLAAGGVVSSLGAVVYGLKRPGRHARYIGYHEYFHAATVVAAAVHYAAVWLVVSSHTPAPCF
ncbi:hemeolysin-III related [Corynebacterium ciconiae DSM 44920]|uniref:PAQR family membrane homeostasis protein TrhA n=1 Tax=Corynebacterium ciconiae TaxID=227319 RepID=UPI0003A7F738|nr:hemolysin III family protein [Corynebacterium ciconiae]WKD60728.1 hemeolysin-III related [Corynebacterium ciconiae DSM 44920]